MGGSMTMKVAVTRSIFKSILVVVSVSASQVGGSTRIKMALTPIQRPLVPPRYPSTHPAVWGTKSFRQITILVI